MSSELVKPLVRNAIIGFALGLVVVFTVGYTLSRTDGPTPVLHR
jgi:hypothetical protein